MSVLITDFAYVSRAKSVITMEISNPWKCFRPYLLHVGYLLEHLTAIEFMSNSFATGSDYIEQCIIIFSMGIGLVLYWF